MMIECKEITKIYGNTKVLNRFSYVFPEHGLYIIKGESGSGKTTLINILAGLISFDFGTICVNGTESASQIDPNCYTNGYDYMTQDVHFIDYISVEENLELITDNKDKINTVLNQFGLNQIKKEFPTNLSGGERQKLALARSLIMNKSTIFADEPTASVDKESKKEILNLLKNMSKKILVICATHDPELICIADDTIYLSKAFSIISSTHEMVLTHNKKLVMRQNSPKKRLRTLTKFISKWFISQKRRKKADLLLFVFMTFAACLCMLADTPEAKLASNMKYIYKINSLNAVIYTDKVNDFPFEKGSDGILDIAISYTQSLPDILNENEENGVDKYYDMILYAIPFEKKAFKMSNEIISGDYFSDKNDIILSYEMAVAISGEDLDSVIGRHMTIFPYGKEPCDVKVVGVLKKPNKFEIEYLRSIGIPYTSGINYNPENYRNLFFCNSIFINDCVLSDAFKNSTQTGYQLYFDNYDDMIRFYDSHSEFDWTLHYDDFSPNIKAMFSVMSYILLPFAAIVIILAILFYSNIIKTELSYNNGFISTFNYLGYGLKEIKYIFTTICILRLAIICSVSAFSAFLLTLFFNIINLNIAFIEYQVFTYNPIIIVLFILIVCVCSTISLNYYIHKLSVKTWYENLIAIRDLI